MFQCRLSTITPQVCFLKLPYREAESLLREFIGRQEGSVIYYLFYTVIWPRPGIRELLSHQSLMYTQDDALSAATDTNNSEMILDT